MPMSDIDFQQAGVRDPRLALHAASPLPAWLWSTDGSRLVWSNAAGAAAFGLRGRDIAANAEGSADANGHQITQLAGQLSQAGVTRLERLRGFGAPLGRLLTCACTRLEFADSITAILVAAIEPVGHRLSFVDRLSFVVDGLSAPAIAFSSDGGMLAWNAAAEEIIGAALTLADLGLDDVRSKALRDGGAEMLTGHSRARLCRLGGGTEIGLVAMITPAEPKPVLGAPESEQPELAPANDEQAEAVVDEAFADEILVDEDLTEEPAGASASNIPAASKVASERVAAPDPDPQQKPAPILTSEFDEPQFTLHHRPLRFLWQMDADGRFSLGSDEFSRLIGPQTAAALGRPWSEIAATFQLDPDGLIAKAVAKRDTWSGIVLDWPLDGAGFRLPVELSGLPIYEREQRFVGYRGFGICRDLEGLKRLAELRRQDNLFATRLLPVAESVIPPSTVAAAGTFDPGPDPAPANLSSAAAPYIHSDREPETVPPENVVQFRPASDTKTPALSPGENSAFDEIARRLNARLDHAAHVVHSETPFEPFAADESIETDEAETAASGAASSAAWLAGTAEPPRGDSKQDTLILDRIPVGVLIYANDAFLRHAGFESLNALTDAGGLDALFVEPAPSSASSESESGTQLMIAAPGDGHAPAQARLFTIAWDGESAMALILSATGPKAAAAGLPPPADRPVAIEQPSAPAGDDFHAILDGAADGIVLFDRSGDILSSNRSAGELFGYSADELADRNLADLFAPESQRVVLDYFESIDRSGVTSLLDHGREVLGRIREGGPIALSMTMGRTNDDGERFFAVFRDLSQVKKTETDLFSARRRADRATAAKSEVIARISHDIRAPLNAIIGFADVMIEQRFGPLGNERYIEYMKDIRASGERVLAIVGDMLDLSQIEAGKLDLSFAHQNLNDVVEQSVAVLQPQANRERIIIRTSLAHALPPVFADARTLSQIVMNLVTGSIRLSNPGGQVIVSTAQTDTGDTALRVRDAGTGMSEQEIAAAMEPYGAASTDRVAPDRPGANLSLTRALTQANRAQFHIRSTPQSGTLIEVAFPTVHASIGGG